MKRVMLFASLFFFNFSYSQSLPRYDDIKLGNAADYRAADSFALKAAVVLLSTPFNKDNVERQESLKFLITWMAGTPDFSFSPNADIARGNDQLLDIYMAAVAKFCLDNRSLSKNKKIVKLNAVKTLLTYCGNPENNIKMTAYLQKLNEANQKGELEKVL